MTQLHLVVSWCFIVWFFSRIRFFFSIGIQTDTFENL